MVKIGVHLSLPNLYRERFIESERWQKLLTSQESRFSRDEGANIAGVYW